MATNDVAPIAMPNGMTNRTDRGLVQRVQKVQRDAKLNRASGGEYNARNTANSLMVGTDIATTGSAVTSGVQLPTIKTTGGASALPPVDLMAPGNAGTVPYSEGSPFGPGKTSTNYPDVEFPDSGSALARAMLAQNPTNPQLVAIVQAFNEAGL